MSIKFSQHTRGMYYYEFKDSYGANCSLSESSAARIEYEDGHVSDGKIWFGMDSDHEGYKAGIIGKTVNLPDGTPTPVGSRMHLSQSMVRELLPLLEYFAEHGELPEQDSD